MSQYQFNFVGRNTLLVVAVLVGMSSSGAEAAVVAQWSFNEGSGNAANSSVGGYTGTLVGFADTSAGAGNPVGGSGWTTDGRLNFNNGGSRVETNFPLSLLANKSFTVEFMASHNSPALSWSSVTGASAGNIFFLGKTAGNTSLHANLDAEVAGGLGRSFSDTNTTIADGEMHHVAVVCDDLADTQELFFDYVSVNLTAGVTGVLRSNGNLWIGLEGIGGGRFGWDGYISELRISDAVLGPDDFLVENDIPEPSTMILLGIGSLGLIGYRRRRQR